MQFQVDINQEEVNVVKMIETTAFGTAFFARLSTGFFPSQKYTENIEKEKITYRPRISREDAEKKYLKWKCEVNALRNFKGF